jgi:hypothetical protein
MKVDTQPFPNVNMVEGYNRSTRRQLDFTLGINMAGHASRQHTRRREADSRDRPQKEEKTISLKNRSGTSEINDRFLLIF